MNWIVLLGWMGVALTLVQARARWQLAGGITVRRFMKECGHIQGMGHALLFWSGIFSLVVLPFAIIFDFIPPPLIPVLVPFALTAILGTTGPTSFLVLGPTRGQTINLCSSLSGRFSFLRASAALDPMQLGYLDDQELGPSENLWKETGRPWWRHVAQLMENAPLIIFDGRHITENTRWELFHLLMSPHLCRGIVLGPVEDYIIAEFLHDFGGIPVIREHVLLDVVKAAASSRKHLLEWYERRQITILSALRRVENVAQMDRSYEPSYNLTSVLYIQRFY